MGRNVNVGVLQDSPAIKASLRNNKVLFSPEHAKFALVDSSNHTQKFLDFDEYHQMVELGYIIFHENTREYIESYYRENIQSQYRQWGTQQDTYMQQLEGQYYGQDNAPIYQQPGPYAQQPYNPAQIPYDEQLEPQDIEKNGSEKKNKNPTKNLKSFFVIAFVIAVIIILLRLFGGTILATIAHLIS